MTVTMTDWSQLNAIGRSYLDVTQNKVSCGHRIDKLEYQELKNMGLVEITETNERGDMKKWRIKKGYEERAERVKEELRKTRGYQIMVRHKKALEAEQKLLLKDAMELIGPSEIWTWCHRVKGLGVVAALTFLAYINPEKCHSASMFYSYVGLTPKSRLKKGERGSFNPEIKGRLTYCCGNTIMHKDPYYYGLYIAKKDYYERRPDTDMKIAQKIKGVPARNNARARMVLTKLIVSHAIEIILREHGKQIPRHRYYIPPKPDDIEECMRIVDMYKEQQAFNLEEIKRRMVETGMSIDDAKEKLSWPPYED